LVKDFLDEDEDFMEIEDIQYTEFIAWRHCSEEYLAENQYNMLSYFANGDTDIYYFKWDRQYDERRAKAEDARLLAYERKKKADQE